jgi:hypothetical protein
VSADPAAACVGPRSPDGAVKLQRKFATTHDRPGRR